VRQQAEVDSASKVTFLGIMWPEHATKFIVFTLGLGKPVCPTHIHDSMWNHSNNSVFHLHTFVNYRITCEDINGLKHNYAHVPC
jgi:hypothetical protein